jgi:methylmalonyl-CoA mutase
MIVRLSTFLSSAPSPKSGRTADVSDKGSPTILSAVWRMMRATEEEKEAQSLPRSNGDLSRLSGIATVEDPASRAGQALKVAYATESAEWLRKLQDAAVKNQNMFEALMEAYKYCSLGQLTQAMFEVGGQYRRNM